MKKKEASARIKINRLLEEAGWRFFDDENGPANIQLEPNVKMSKADLTGLGENFDKVKNGFADFLLLDDKGTQNAVRNRNFSLGASRFWRLNDNPRLACAYINSFYCPFNG